MSEPVIIFRGWDSARKLTVLRVSVPYIPSFCKYLFPMLAFRCVAGEFHP